MSETHERCTQDLGAYLVLLYVVLTGRVGFGLAIDFIILVPAASMVACSTLISEVVEAPVHQVSIFSMAHMWRHLLADTTNHIGNTQS